MRLAPAVLLAICLSAATAHATPLFEASFRSHEVTAVPRVAVIRDFDEDGVNDIAVGSSPNTPRVTLLRGTGDGSYAAAESISVSFGEGLEAADLDGDGHLDLVVYEGDLSGTLSILRGHGDLTFDAPLALTPGGTGRALLLADVVGSPAPDLIAPESTGLLGIRPGTGGLAFGAPLTVPVSGTVFGLAAADLDADGKVDLVVESYDGSAFHVEVHRNLGGGSFAAPSLPAGTFGSGIAVADLDSDGVLDIVVGARWLRGTGGGALAAPVLFGDPDASLFTVGDLDEDGALDVVTSGDATAPAVLNMFQVHRGLGGGAFAAVEHIPSGYAPGFAALGDLDGDPYPDLLVLCGNLSQVCAYRGLGRNGLAETPRLANGGEAVDVLVAEATDDGIPDLLAVSTMDARVRLFPGNGDLTFGTPIDLATPADVRRVAVGDIDADGVPDLVTANGMSGSISFFKGVGGGAFAPRVDRVTAGTPTQDVVIDDIGADGFGDVIVVSPLSVFPGGAAGLGARQDYATSGVVVRTARLDADPHADVLVLAPSLLSWRRGQPAGTLGAAGSLTRTEHYSLAVLDLDADGDLDALTSTRLNEKQFRIALGDGAGNFVEGPIQAGLRRILAAEPADLDGDGTQDVVMANYFSGAAAVCRGLGTGAVAMEAAYGAMGSVLDVSVGDLDGDGWPDVVCALDDDWFTAGSTGHVSILRNTQGRLLAVDPQPPLVVREAGAVWPNPVRAGGTLRVAFTLPARGDVALDVFDLAGRRLAHEILGVLGAGAHQRDLAVGTAWSPGLYWVRVAQGGRISLHRAVVTR